MLRINNSKKNQTFSTITGLQITIPAGTRFDDASLPDINFEDLPDFPAIKENPLVVNNEKQFVLSETHRLHFIINTFGTNLYYLKENLQKILEYAETITIVLLPFNGKNAAKYFTSLNNVVMNFKSDKISIFNAYIYTTDCDFNDIKKVGGLYSVVLESLNLQYGDCLIPCTDSDIYYNCDVVVSSLQGQTQGVCSYLANCYWREFDFIGWTEKRYLYIVGNERFTVVAEASTMVKWVRDSNKVVDLNYKVQNFSYLHPDSYIIKLLAWQRQQGFTTDDDWERKYQHKLKFVADVYPRKNAEGLILKSQREVGAGDKPYFLNKFLKLLFVIVIDDNCDHAKLMSFCRSLMINRPSIDSEVLLLISKNISESKYLLAKTFLSSFSSVKVYSLDKSDKIAFSSFIEYLVFSYPAKFISFLIPDFLIKKFGVINDAVESLQHFHTLVSFITENMVKAVTLQRELLFSFLPIKQSSPLEFMNYLQYSDNLRIKPYTDAILKQ